MPAKPPSLKDLPINRIVPNVVTIFALSAGMTSLRFAVLEQWQNAVLAIFAAAILDALDGRVARILRGTTKFGAELDSLSDFLSFGVAPAFLLFYWSLNGTKGGWTIALFFAVCASLRLARFNTMLEEEPPAKEWARYFVGIPAPGGAGIVLLPMVFWFHMPEAAYLRSPLVVAIALFCVGLMMVSRIPTFAVKYCRIPRAVVIPLLLIIALMTTYMISHPFETLSLLGLFYLLTIPWTVFSFLRTKKRLQQEKK